MDVLEQAVALRAERQPFVLATVVAAQAPTSGTPGARAIILPNGEMTGWVGGSCAQETVVRQALEALAEGSPRLIVLSPDGSPTEQRSGVIRLATTCASQGELQIYIEPFVPKIELAVVGPSPVADTLASLAKLLDFDVSVCGSAAELPRFASALTERSFVVVTTIGQYDEEALHAVLGSHAVYVGLVASRRRLATVLDYLRGRGLDEQALARVQRPGGLEAHTVLPAEIAFSVMAELLQERRQRLGLLVADQPAEAIDPICGMTIAIDQARFVSERDGEKFYFCCAGCQAKFEAA